MEYYYGFAYHSELTGPDGRLVTPDEGETCRSLAQRGYTDSPIKAGFDHGSVKGDQAKSTMQKVQDGLIPAFDVFAQEDEDAKEREAQAEMEKARISAAKQDEINNSIRQFESGKLKAKHDDEKLKDWKNDEGTLDKKGKHKESGVKPIDAPLPDVSI